MTGSQYKNVAQWTLANCGFLESGDSAAVAKAIFDNMGVAFPKGGYSDIMLTLLSEDYMGWCSCTFAQAQEFANAGTAAIGIDPARVVVILPDESADNVILPVEAPVTPYATDTAGITTQDRMSMQFFAYAKGTSSSEKPPVTPPSDSTPAKVQANQLFSQAQNVPFPAGSGYSGNAFNSTAFIKNVCNRRSASDDYTIKLYGCAICSLAMFILYKGGLANSDINVYNAVKEATILSTDDRAWYVRRNFTAIVGGKSIKVNSESNSIIPSNKDLTPVKNALLSGKCVMLSLRTYLPDPNAMHWVLADELVAGNGSDLDLIKVADPANGQRRTLRSAIERKLSPASSSYIITGYCVS